MGDLMMTFMGDFHGWFNDDFDGDLMMTFRGDFHGWFNDDFDGDLMMTFMGDFHGWFNDDFDGDLKQETIRNGDVHHVFLGDFMMISWWF